VKGTNPIQDLNGERESDVKAQIAANRFDSNPTKTLDAQGRIDVKTLEISGKVARVLISPPAL
jgi:hypothetical protein